MKTLIKTLTVIFFLSFGLSYASYSQNDTAKQSTAEKVKDKADELFEKDEDEVDHNHSALKEDVDDMMESLNEMELSGNFDRDYANMMIQFHETGIDLCRAEIMRGNNDALKESIKENMEWQSAEIDRLKDFVKDFDDSGKKHDESILRSAVQKKLEDLHAMKITGDIDKDFAKMMTRYHAHAIDLHKMELEHGVSAELKQLAENSIKEQGEAIVELRKWMDDSSK